MKLILVPHQSEWAAKFARLRDEITHLLASNLLNLEHFGSTSIPNIKAKPIVDITGEVHSLPVLDAILSTQLPLHITNLGENGLPGRRYLVIADSHGETQAHVHLFGRGDPSYSDRLLFRDYLRRHGEVAKKYEVLKLDLAARFGDDPQSYWLGKSEFVTSVLACAKVQAKLV